MGTKETPRNMNEVDTMNNDEIENPIPEMLDAPMKIFVDQVGYRPADEKVAVLTFPASRFSVTDADGRQVLSGDVTSAGFDAASGEKVVKIGVFEPATGDSGAGGKQEMLGMQYANHMTPTVDIGGETGA